jgi:hypothetical protein
MGQSAKSKSDNKAYEMKKIRSNIQIEPRFYYGFIINHHTELEPFNAHLPIFEISLIKDTYGKRYWEQIHNYPHIGISFFYSTLSDNPSIGQVAGAYPFISFPILKDRKNYMGFRLGIGLGYITKTFDRLDNYKNIAIGSHLNVAANLMIEYKRKINKMTFVGAGFGLFHFSNGSTASPNYGLNLPMASVAVSRRIAEPHTKIPMRKPLIPLFGYRDNKIYVFNLLGGYASKNMGDVFGERYDVYMKSLSGLKVFNEISSFGVSLDFSLDYSHRAMLIRNGWENPDFFDIMRPGVSPTYEMTISNLILGAGIGFYFGGKERSDGDIYEQLTIKYIMYKSIFAHVTLRAHAARAGFVAWGIGYRLKYDWGK